MKRYKGLNEKLVALALTLSVLASFLLPALNILPVYGSTTVSGQITSNTIWTKANSPYIVTGNILVSQGVTLTIEPGVTVKFDSQKLIQIDGQLVAKGTQSEPIVFTSNYPSPSPGDWAGIEFTDSSVDAMYGAEGNYVSGSIMQYCTVEYSNGLEVRDSSPFVDHSTIMHNANSGIRIYDYAEPKITNNTIAHNSAQQGGGIYIDYFKDHSGLGHTGTPDLTIMGNRITNNSASEDGGGIYAFCKAEDSRLTINNNVIANNCGGGNGGGIWVHSEAWLWTTVWGTEQTMVLTISNSDIASNSAGQHGGGIYVWDDYGILILTISDNSLTSNSASGDGGGIHYDSRLYGNVGLTLMVTKNAMTGNSALNGGGIWARDGSWSGKNWTVSANTIAENFATYDGGGMYYTERGGGEWDLYYGFNDSTLVGNTIVRNSAMRDGGGIYHTNGLAQSTFIGNTIAFNSAVEGAGIYPVGNGDTMTHNTIVGNSISQGNGKAGGFLVSGQPSINYNNVHGNTPYDICNSNSKGSPDVDATNNWWGTTDEVTIEAHIYHWVDDSSRGLVTSKPYLTAPIPSTTPTPSFSFTNLQPPSITTTASTYDAELTAIGTNFNNVDRVTFTWSGPDSGTDIWDKGDSDWNSKVKVNSDTSMTLRPRILSDETSAQTKTWTWTVTLRDTTGATASQSFTVTYTPTSENLNAIIQELTIDRVAVTVAGQTYFILTLEHRIDPATLKIVADSGQIKVYVDVSGNPVSDGEVAQKIGIIETACGIIDPQLPQRIALLEETRELVSQTSGTGWVNMVTSGVVDLIKLIKWQKAYDFYDFLRYWDATRTVWGNMNDATVKSPPTGLLVKAATALLQKLFGEPFAEIKKDLQNSLSGAISHYNSIEGIDYSKIVDYDEAYRFLSNLYHGKSEEEMAHYLNGKICKNIVNLFDAAGPTASLLALGANVPLVGTSLALLEFPKLAWKAKLALDWTVDTLYRDVVNQYKIRADLLYKLTDNAKYSLELAQAHREVTGYEVKCVNEQATGYAEAAKIPQAVYDYLADIDTWWDSFITVMKKIMLQSPGELRVYDSQERVTGLVNGEVREEIPEAVYSDGVVLIFNATDSYRYEVVGTDHGTYGLEITSKEGEEAEGLAFANVAIAPYEVHRYTIGGGTLSSGQAAATIEIDSDGDGVPEETKTLRPPIVAFTFSPSTISINKEINFDASQSSDADGQIVSYQWNFGDGNTSAGETATHLYSVAAEYVVSLAVVDNDGVISTYSRFVQVEERQRMPTWAWAIIAIGILLLAVIVFRKRRTAKVQH